MIQMQTVLEVADNSGAQNVTCIKVLGGSHRMIAELGDVIVVSVSSIKKGASGIKVKKGTVQRAVIVRTKSSVKRVDGGTIKFDDNAVVLINKQNEPIGSRVFGPVARELRKKFLKIISLAAEVL